MAAGQYRLDLRLVIEPDVHTGKNFFGQRAARFTATRAEGTFVEIENTGEVLTFDTRVVEDFSGDAAQFSPEDTERLKHPTLSTPQKGLPDREFNIARADRPLVLLAVGGGNQVFDHWEGGRCAGQGARCEVPEPQTGAFLIEAAVFKKKQPDLEVIAPFNPGLFESVRGVIRSRRG